MMNQLKKFSTLLALLALGGAVHAQTGPAITSLRVGISGGSDDFHYYGQSGGIAGYSVATTSCNPGTMPVNWDNNDHPVIGQNFFRLKDGRFEQLGQSWLKHGFCAVNESGCGSCQTTDCDSLGIGCADTYWATLNDGQGGGPKYLVNANTGVHVDPTPNPTGPTAIRGRLQVAVSDMDPALNPGADYFAEIQYVSAHTAMAGNGGIANSWRKLNVASVSNISGGGPTVIGECAPYAWQAEDPQVVVTDFQNTDEGGAGVHGHYTLGSRVTDLGGGMFRYDYVVYNRTSERSAGSFSVPKGSGVAISNVYFNDAEYHSGEPFDSNDWLTMDSGNLFTWHTDQPYAGNPDANAIRWGNMWSFGFDADAAPQAGLAEVGMFMPGLGDNVLFVAVPAPGDDVGTAYCAGDGSGTPCPCSNDNNGHMGGCSWGSASFPAGGLLTANGSASMGANDTFLVATGIENNFGIFFGANDRVNGGNGNPLNDGLRCAGGALVRLVSPTMASGHQAVLPQPVQTLDTGASSGMTRRYQYWFRTPGGPCGTSANLTNGYEIVWTP